MIPNEAFPWVLGAFLVLCFAAMVCEIVEHIQHRKFMKELSLSLPGFLKEVFGPPDFLDTTRKDWPDKKDKRQN